MRDPAASSKERSSPAGWQLLAAFAVVTVALVTATYYTQVKAGAIDVAALSIARDASPSIQQLTRARGALWQLEVLLDRAAASDGAVARPNWERVEQARRELDAATRAYLALPL